MSADFLTTILTPGLPAAAIPQFAAGLVYEFIGVNNLEAFEGCWSGGKQIET